MSARLERPVVLVIAGHDPSGGAGQIADIQAVTALGGHPAVAVSSLTEQDTRNVIRVMPVHAQDVAAQARAVLADMPVAAIKLGLLPTPEIGRVVADVLADHPSVPVVLDPVLVASGGGTLAQAPMRALLAGRLAPMACVMTPNLQELRALAGCDASAPVEAAARRLLAAGCRAVLATDGDGESDGGRTVVNRLFTSAGVTEWPWPRLEPPGGSFHGTGCTLAAALATGLAAGQALPAACEQAQRFVAASLASAIRPGRGQAIPDRTVSGWRAV